MAPQNAYFSESIFHHQFEPMRDSLTYWSSTAPQRMRGSRALKHIPNEIYLAIFDLLRPGPFSSFSVQEHKAILSNLMLVCHFFRDACAPRRYSSLQITGLQKRHVDFCNAIRKSPRLVPDNMLSLVKELSFSDWLSPTEANKWVVKGLLNVYSTTIDKFPNVTSISLVKVSIGSVFFDAVAEMKSLHDVEFTKCAFEPLTTKQPAKTARSPWTNFTFIECYEFETYLPHLKVLTSSSALTSFTTTHDDVARVVLEEPIPFDNLKTLSIPYDNVDNAFIADALLRAQNIEFLAFPFAQDPSTLAKFRPPKKTLPLRLPTSALRKLKTLQCPSWLVKDLIVDRSTVTDVDISAELSVGRLACLYDHDVYAMPRLLNALGSATTQIRSLAIGVNALALKYEDERKGLGIEDLESLETLKLYVSRSWDFKVSR